MEITIPDRVIRIGCASGSLRDSALALPQLLRSGAVDYVVFDFLAEGSMGLLAMWGAGRADAGFAPDFIDIHIRPHLAEIMRRGVKIVANAGGVNPAGCAEAVRRIAAEFGLQPRIATVAGDDLRDRIETLRAQNIRDMFSGLPLPEHIES